MLGDADVVATSTMPVCDTGAGIFLPTAGVSLLVASTGRLCVYACMRVCVYACSMRVCVYACTRVRVYACTRVCAVALRCVALRCVACACV